MKSENKTGRKGRSRPENWIEVAAAIISLLAGVLSSAVLEEVVQDFWTNSLSSTIQGLGNVFTTIIVIVISISVGAIAINYIVKWYSNRSQEYNSQLSRLREAEHNLFEEIKVRTVRIIEERIA